MKKAEHRTGNSTKIYIMSCIALLSIGFSFSLRTSIAGDLAQLFDTTDPLRSSAMVGAVLGLAFLGYAITLFVVSPFLNAIGMGRLMKASAVFLTAGTLIIAFSEHLTLLTTYRTIWLGMLTIGVGWGLVDAVTNPLLITLYPADKTHKLNVLHAWWPGGIMIGGILGLLADRLGVDWNITLCLSILPVLVYGGMCFSLRFPLTERAAAGISFFDMFRELLRRPVFFVWIAAMFLTAASELAPGQWVDHALSRVVGMRGIWILIYVSGLMFVMRHFAGSLSKWLSPVGILWISSLLTGIGLFLLSVANSPLTALLAATIWGVGVCYLWPTMLASVSERFPKGGSLAMGLMGTGGTLSIYFALPAIGKIYDHAKIVAAGGEEAFTNLGGEKLNEVLSVASRTSFRYIAILPVILLVVFGAFWIYDRMKGGYNPEKLNAEES